jgi:hypothetical protein
VANRDDEAKLSAESRFGEEAEDATLIERFAPEPRSAAIATMAVLAFGVIIGAATGPLAQSAAVTPIIVEVIPEVAEAPPPALEEVPEALAEAPLAPPEAVTSGSPPEPLGEGSVPIVKPPPEEFPSEELPPIEHVFMVVLGDHGYEEAFGQGSSMSYLAQTLRDKGELLSNYYAVTQGDLANEIALLSGQGPTPATTEDCPEYENLDSTGVGTEEQVEGDGCVYPAETKTLVGQLVEAKRTWKAYFPGGGACAGESPRNPFAYFRSLLDTPQCAERSADLAQLAADLESETTTPSFSYVSVDEERQLEDLVPEIQESIAYKKGGLVAILSAQAPQSGPNADSSACCGTPEYPNLPPPSTPPAASGPVKPSGGGGRVGLLLLSPYLEAGTVNESGYFNHFSLLLSIEELFELPPIGYAASPTLVPFGSSGVYNLSS